MLKLDVEAKLKQIFETAFVSNYYSAHVHAIGGTGVSKFAETLKSLDNPTEVLKQITDYMKDLKYEASVPTTFTTGLLDQFLAQEGEILLFDPFNRRISDLFLSYEEYRLRRQQVWNYLKDDSQSVWGNAVDTSAWAYLGKLDTVISTIEAKAQVCKEAASSASRLALRGRPPAPARGGPASPADDDRRLAFLRDFSIGISSRFVSEQVKNIPRMMSNPATDCTGAARPNNPDEIDQARAALCECLKKDESVYLKERFPIAAVPSVKVVHEKTVFAPRSILYISVTLAGKLTKAELKDRTGALVVALTGGVDPDHGPIWYGSTLYRDGSGNPPGPDRLPFTLEMTDFLGRAYTKPVVVTD